MMPVMPLFAPLYTVGSEVADVRWLTLVYRTDPERIASLLPGPLRPAPEPEVLVWVADFLSATFTGSSGARSLPPYTQGGVAVRARHDDLDVAYPLVSYITGLNHGFTGRELFGLPKKQARSVELREADGGVSATITTASDIEVIRVTGTTGAVESSDGLVPEWFCHQRTVKLIPSATGEGYDVDQLTAVPFVFDDQRRVRSLEVDLALRSSAADPVAELPCREIVGAQIGDTALGVGYGTYLGAPESHPMWGTP